MAQCQSLSMGSIPWNPPPLPQLATARPRHQSMARPGGLHTPLLSLVHWPFRWSPQGTRRFVKPSLLGRWVAQWLMFLGMSTQKMDRNMVRYLHLRTLNFPLIAGNILRTDIFKSVSLSVRNSGVTPTWFQPLFPILSTSVNGIETCLTGTVLYFQSPSLCVLANG